MRVQPNFVLSLIVLYATITFLAGAVCPAQTVAVSSDQDLTGEWSVTVFSTSWKVQLAHDKDKEKPGDGPTYCGTAVRRGNDGKDITIEMCAFLKEDNTLVLVDQVDLGSNLKVRSFTCEAPFTASGTMSGMCVFGDSVGGGAETRGPNGLLRAFVATWVPSHSPTPQDAAKVTKKEEGATENLEDWQTSYPAYMDQLAAAKRSDMPSRFGDKVVVWEGVFQSFDSEKNAGKSDKDRVTDLEIKLPEINGPVIVFRVHVISKASSAEKWKVVKQGTRVQFRGKLIGSITDEQEIRGITIRSYVHAISNVELVKILPD